MGSAKNRPINSPSIRRLWGGKEPTPKKTDTELEELFPTGECSNCGTCSLSDPKNCYNCGYEMPNILLTKSELLDLITQSNLKLLDRLVEELPDEWNHSCDKIICAQKDACHGYNKCLSEVTSEIEQVKAALLDQQKKGKL